MKFDYDTCYFIEDFNTMLLFAKEFSEKCPDINELITNRLVKQKNLFPVYIYLNLDRKIWDFDFVNVVHEDAEYYRLKKDLVSKAIKYNKNKKTMEIE